METQEYDVKNAHAYIYGTFMENGEFPHTERMLKKLVEGVCCENARRYFSL